MEKHQINFSVFDNMIYNEPMRWQSIECDIEGNIFFLTHLNNYIENFPLHDLLIDEIPEEYEYLFSMCSPQDLKAVRDELLSCLN
jgi:hypothetical protein